MPIYSLPTTKIVSTIAIAIVHAVCTVKSVQRKACEKYSRGIQLDARIIADGRERWGAAVPLSGTGSSYAIGAMGHVLARRTLVYDNIFACRLKRSPGPPSRTPNFVNAKANKCGCDTAYVGPPSSVRARTPRAISRHARCIRHPLRVCHASVILDKHRICAGAPPGIIASVRVCADTEIKRIVQ